MRVLYRLEVSDVFIVRRCRLRPVSWRPFKLSLTLSAEVSSEEDLNGICGTSLVSSSHCLVAFEANVFQKAANVISSTERD